VQNQVEDMLAEEILAGRIKTGDTVHIVCRKDKIMVQTDA
jgi:ATP-dependent Clp protease ATP-binding subunit ClpA